MSAIPTYPEAARQHYLDQVDHVVDRLRRLADEVERSGKDLREHPLTRSDFVGVHSKAAVQVMHEVTWGLANANLDSLIRAAAEADGAALADRSGA